MCLYDHFMGSLLNKHHGKGTQYISIANLTGKRVEIDRTISVFKKKEF